MKISLTLQVNITYRGCMLNAIVCWCLKVLSIQVTIDIIYTSRYVAYIMWHIAFMSVFRWGLLLDYALYAVYSIIYHSVQLPRYSIVQYTVVMGG